MPSIFMLRNKAGLSQPYFQEDSTMNENILEHFSIHDPINIDNKWKNSDWHKSLHYHRIYIELYWMEWEDG